jgi:hypothetical protein
MRKLAERNNVYVVEDNGKIKTLIKDTYTELKLSENYEGNRIFHDFGNGLSVKETYDERIFNCFNGEVTINIRDGNKIAEFISDSNSAGYEVYFKDHYYKQHRTEFLERVISTYGDRVVKVQDGYIVDDIWKVSNEGSSYYLAQSGHKGNFDTDTVRVHGENSQGVVGNWHFLCTVAQGKFMSMSIDTEIGILELDETTITILAKINFLMNPNVNDSVFMNQLPDKTKKLLIAEKDEQDGGVLK